MHEVSKKLLQKVSWWMLHPPFSKKKFLCQKWHFPIWPPQYIHEIIFSWYISTTKPDRNVIEVSKLMFLRSMNATKFFQHYLSITYEQKSNMAAKFAIFFTKMCVYMWIITLVIVFSVSKDQRWLSNYCDMRLSENKVRANFCCGKVPKWHFKDGCYGYPWHIIFGISELVCLIEMWF